MDGYKENLGPIGPNCLRLALAMKALVVNALGCGFEVDDVEIARPRSVPTSHKSTSAITSSGLSRRRALYEPEKYVCWFAMNRSLFIGELPVA